jgi:hypothetical protein
VFDVVFVASRFSTLDTIPPEVTSFDVNPKNTTDSITATWTVTDNQALKQTELWRTDDDNGQPDEGNWSLIPGKVQSISGTQASGQFTDTPPNGTFWYNLHVIDNADNTGYAQPINVTKSPPSGNVIYAASGSADDIQTAINSASDGDTVIIPAGTHDFGNGHVELIDKLIHIKGTGRDSTIIQKTGTEADDKRMFQVYMPYKTGGPVFSDMKLIDTNGPYEEYSADNRTKGIVLGTGCWNFRVYNMEFEGFGESGLEASEYSGAEEYEWKQQGIIYNCNFINNYMPGLGYGVVVYGANDKSWDEPIELGTAYSVFVEDNYFEGNRHHIAANWGSRYVFRYNTCRQNNAPAIDAHGCDPPCETHRGTRSVEIYGNDVRDPGVGTQAGFGPTGVHAGVVYNNTFEDMYYGCYLMAAGCYEAEPPCEYPSPDQIRELYIWGNTYINCDNEVYVNPVYADLIQEDRDYFLEEKSGYTAYTYPHPLREGL